MIPVLPLQLLPIMFAAAIAVGVVVVVVVVVLVVVVVVVVVLVVVVVVLLLLLPPPFLSTLHAFFLYCTANANAHCWNYLKDVVSGCPSDFAIAVSATKNDGSAPKHH